MTVSEKRGGRGNSIKYLKKKGGDETKILKRRGMLDRGIGGLKRGCDLL